MKISSFQLGDKVIVIFSTNRKSKRKKVQEENPWELLSREVLERELAQHEDYAQVVVIHEETNQMKVFTRASSERS